MIGYKILNQHVGVRGDLSWMHVVPYREYLLEVHTDSTIVVYLNL